jgi:hypothetical protein
MVKFNSGDDGYGESVGRSVIISHSNLDRLEEFGRKSLSANQMEEYRCTQQVPGYP